MRSCQRYQRSSRKTQFPDLLPNTRYSESTNSGISISGLPTVGKVIVRIRRLKGGENVVNRLHLALVVADIIGRIPEETACGLIDMNDSKYVQSSGPFDALYLAFLENISTLRPSLHRYCSAWLALCSMAKMHSRWSQNRSQSRSPEIGGRTGTLDDVQILVRSRWISFNRQ